MRISFFMRVLRWDWSGHLLVPIVQLAARGVQEASTLFSLRSPSRSRRLAAEVRDVLARQAAEADRERRRIERAIHDGVQQDLAALSVRLQLARRLAGTDLGSALALLGEIEADVRESLARVARLANEIYPSLLDARGLGDALRDAAAAAGVPLSIEAADERYPAEVEAAVYFFCRDVLGEVAGPTRAAIGASDGSVRLVIEGGAVVTPPDSALDRVEAFGGSVTLEPGGIAASFPLEDARSREDGASGD
jgi:signal transduction histidine kinase